jgi:hypothetical protein
MRQPNLFIVGAPKSGTTAIYEYLRAHRNVFMSDPKEPAYFATDLPGLRGLGPHPDYAALFAAATDEERVIGEGSTCYIYSQVAAANIREFNRAAKIVVMLRNPADAVVSFHAQLCYDTDEDQADFETAWRLQAERRQGHAVPRYCRAPDRLQYQRVFQLGSHVERILEFFPQRQIKLIRFDDFITAPATVYEGLLMFLGLPSDDRRDFSDINRSKQHRLRWLGRLTMQPPPLLQRSVDALKRKLGLASLGLGPSVIRWNRRYFRRRPIRAELRQELTDTFRTDILKLAQIMNRDLSDWL